MIETVTDAKLSLVATSRRLAKQYASWAAEGGKDTAKWQREHDRLIDQAAWYEAWAARDLNDA